jgi:hypothetical protein
MKIARRAGWSVVSLVLASGCQSLGQVGDGDEETAEIQLAIMMVPSGTPCVRMTSIANGRTLSQEFTVTPGASATLQMRGLAAGPTTLLAEAFSAACSSVSSSTRPTWSSEPTLVNLLAGQNTAVTLVLRRAAGANVGLDFVDGTGGAALSLTPASFDFGTVFTEQSVTTTLTLRNTGTVATGQLGFGTNDGVIRISGGTCGPTPLAAGASCTLTVRLFATQPGRATDTIRVSATPGGTAQSMISGTVVQGTAALSLTPASFDFGTVFTNQSVSTTLTLTNTGTAPSGGLGFGTNDGVIRISGGTCAPMPLAAGASCTVIVRLFSPQPGPASDTIRIFATPGGTATAMITATVIQPTAVLVLSPSSFNFGTLFTNQSATTILVLSNTGNGPAGPLSFGNNDGAVHFTEAGTCTPSTTLAPGASCTVGIRLMSPSPGPINETMRISATPGGSATAAITATIIQTTPVLSLSPAIVSFGTVLVNQGVTAVLLLQNTGNGPTGPLVFGNNDGNVRIVGGTCTPGAALAPGASCSVTVRLLAAQPGPVNDTIRLSATPGGSATAAVTATVVAPTPVLVLSPPTFNFPPIAVGTSIFGTLELSNTGNGPSGPLSFGNNDGNVRISGGTCQPGTALAAGASCTVIIRLSGVSPGAVSDTIRISATPGGSATTQVTGSVF